MGSFSLSLAQRTWGEPTAIVKCLVSLRWREDTWGCQTDSPAWPSADGNADCPPGQGAQWPHLTAALADFWLRTCQMLKQELSSSLFVRVIYLVESQSYRGDRRRSRGEEDAHIHTELTCSLFRQPGMVQAKANEPDLILPHGCRALSTWTIAKIFGCFIQTIDREWSSWATNLHPYGMPALLQPEAWPVMPQC